MTRAIFVPLCTSLVVSACVQRDANTPAPPTAAPPAPAAEMQEPSPVAQEVLAALDPQTDPCDDFYQYACGGWIETTELPGDKSRWTRSFSVLRENNRALLKDVLEQAARAPDSDAETRKLGTFYASCMDEAAVEQAGFEPLVPTFEKIAKVNDLRAFMRITGELHRGAGDPLFGMYVGPDDKDPDRNIAHIYQGGLGLPDRDYYLAEERKELLEAYREHVAKNFQLVGETSQDAAKIADEIVAFETALAKMQLTRVERRDPDKTYNKIDIGGLTKQVRGLDWRAYLEGTGHPDVVDINVDTVAYLKGMAKLLRKTQRKTQRDYLRWNAIQSAAPHLSKAFVDENFAFYGQKLRGQKEMEVRWKRCASSTDRAMGHALGKRYVEKAFAGDSRAIALDLITRIESAFEDNLPQLSWMDDATRQRAVQKMEAIRNKIGYPDDPRTYDGLTIEAGNYYSNVLAAREFNGDYNADKIGKPVDPTEWRAPPQIVNASYSGTRNEMWFPAGILQAPFFDQSYPMAMNFGGVGMVMGHELTHGFDDQGRKYDGSGTLREWWDEKAVRAFEERASCVGELYSSQEPEPGLHINGDLTMGENIADLGGLKEAFFAYRAWAAQNGGDAEPHVPGLSNEQLFFVANAQVWCTKQTAEALRVQVATDPHSPAQFRVNVPMMSTSEFAQAFACEPGAPMAPTNRCEVW